MQKLTQALSPLIAGALAVGASTNAFGITLGEMATLAKQNDAQYIQAEANYIETRESLPQARSNLLPSLEASLGRSEIDSEIGGLPAGANAYSVGLTGEYATNNVAVNLRQPIYNHGSWAGYDAAKAQVNSAEASYQTAKQSLLLRLTSRYFDALTAEDTLRFAKAEQEAIARQLEDVEKRFEVGSIPETDVKESRAAYDLAQAEVISAENALRNAREALFTMVGQSVELSPLQGELEYAPPQPDDVNAWQEAALQGNAALLAAQANYSALSEEASARQAQHYPSLDLLASYNQNDFVDGNYDGLEQEETRITLQLTVPIYSGGATSSAVRSVIARRDASQSLLSYQRRQAQQDARNAYYDLKAASARARALSVALESRMASREAIKDGFDAGTRTSTDVLDAEREVRRTQRDNARARYDYLLATLRLKEAAGTLSSADIAAIDGLLEH